MNNFTQATESKMEKSAWNAENKLNQTQPFHLKAI